MDDWNRFKEIVTQALVRPEPEREAFLIDACGEDGELYRQASELLRYQAEAGSFLEDSPVRIADGDLSPGVRIGPYLVLRKIGTGGMGEVYLAERADGTYEQEVAIKVLPPTRLVGELLERFVSERQLLAEMRHPNIAPLHDGGTTADGRPYLVMEYVEGRPIDRYCRERGLSIEARLRLFLDVCDAVRHAHHHLVVHRDIKPANILVTEEGVPKLLDFGVAKDLGGDERTPSTRLLLPVTPEYASPEQLTGAPVSTSFDVYALGVVLYELLADENPFADGDDPLAGRSRAAPPTRPSVRVRNRGSPSRRLSRRLAGDLDHVVLRALEPDRAKRYASVEQLARDLDRHLRGLPIETRGGALYRAGKLARRHWKALAASAVVLGLASGLVAETLERRRLEHDRQQLERESGRVTQLSYDLSDYLIDLFLHADPKRSGERSRALEQMLDRGAELLDSGAFADDPIPRAALLGTVGQVYRGLGLFEKGKRLLSESLDLRRKTLEPDDKLIGFACNNLALALRGLGEYGEAKTLLLEARRISSLHRDDTMTAGIVSNLAGIEKELGRFEEAVDFYREALALKRRLTGGLSTEGPIRAMKNLGAGLRAAGRLEEAETILWEALGELDRLEEEAPDARAGVEHHLGGVLRDRGDLAKARELLDRVYEFRVRQSGEGHRQTLETLTELALVDQAEGRLDMAEERLRRVVELRREHWGDEHVDTAKAFVPLARVLAEKGDLHGAVALAEEALEVLRRRLPSGHRCVGDAERLVAELQS